MVNKKEVCKLLTNKQLEAVDMLMDGLNKSAIADKLKVSRTTLYKWIENEEFKLELDRRKQKICNDALSDLKGSTKDLLKAVEKLAYTAENEGIRLQALNSLLDRTLGKATAKQEIELSSNKEAENIDLDTLLEEDNSNVIDLDKIAK